MHNPFAKVGAIYRAALYVLAIGGPALMAGFAAINEPAPDWLTFVIAVVSALSGGAALSHLSPDAGE